MVRGCLMCVSVMLAVVIAGCAGEAPPQAAPRHTPTQYARAANNASVEALQRNDAATAMQKAREAIEDDPDFAMPYYNLALAQLREEDKKSALESLSACTARDPEHASAQLLHGLLLEEQGSEIEARNAYLAARDGFAAAEPPTLQSELFHAIAVYLGEGIAPGLEAVNILVAKYPGQKALKEFQQQMREGRRDFLLEWLLTQQLKQTPLPAVSRERGATGGAAPEEEAADAAGREVEHAP